MYAGRIVERGDRRDDLRQPAASLHRGPAALDPAARRPQAERLTPIPGTVPRHVSSRRPAAVPSALPARHGRCRREMPARSSESRRAICARLLTLHDRGGALMTAASRAATAARRSRSLTKHFPLDGDVFSAGRRADQLAEGGRRRRLRHRPRRDARPGRRERLRQVDDRRALHRSRLIEPTGGEVTLRRRRTSLGAARPRRCGRRAREMQIVFQDPYSLAQPAHDGRRHRSPSRCEIHDLADAGRDRRAGAPSCSTRRPRPEHMRPLPARVLRRPAPAHRHRPRAGGRAASS